MFLAEVVAYAQRVDLSVGIVAMMDRNSTGVDFPVSIHVQQMLQNGWSEVLNPCGGKRFSLLHTSLPFSFTQPFVLWVPWLYPGD